MSQENWQDCKSDNEYDVDLNSKFQSWETAFNYNLGKDKLGDRKLEIDASIVVECITCVRKIKN